LVGCLNSRNEISLISYSQSGGQLNCHVMKLQDLRPPERAQVQGVIPAGSLDEAEAQLRTLSAKALLPCPPPRATSPPADTSATPQPSGAPLPPFSAPPPPIPPNGSTPSRTTSTAPPTSGTSTAPAAPGTPSPPISSETLTALPLPPQQPGVDCRASA
jgi:hypothetical protein